MAAKRPYLDDLQTARLWAKVKALVSPLSSRVTTLEGQVQTNTTDLSSPVSYTHLTLPTNREV